MLATHTDQAFTQYIRRGLCEGFRTGFNYGAGYLKQLSVNLEAAKEEYMVRILCQVEYKLAIETLSRQSPIWTQHRSNQKSWLSNWRRRVTRVGC